MRVRAQKGQKCPKENNPRTYISDDCDGEEVVPTAYYRRLVDDESLVEIDLSDDAVAIQPQAEEDV